MTEDIYHLDYETYSPQPLGNQKSVGAFKYAEDPTAEILIMAIAKNDEPPVAWSVLDKNFEAVELLEEAIDSGAKIYAHNAQFEFAVSKYLFEKTFGVEPPLLTQWRCTAAMCRLAAIPSSLEKAGEFLEIDIPKDKEGTRLINLFSTPRNPTKKDSRTRIMPSDEPEDFQRFVDYCVRDVEAERQIHQKLHKYEMGDINLTLESFQADMRMNDRGIPVNRAALERAAEMMEEYYARLVPKFRSQVAKACVEIKLPITGQRKQPKWVDISEGFNPSQREMFMVWLGDEGYTEDNLQSDTVDDWLEDPRELSEKAQEALYTYSLVQSAAVKKIPAMLKMACEDGYVRGALLIFGAERTHRWTGKGIQPQNYARPKIKMTELAYDCICKGFSIDAIEELFGNFFDVLVSCIRHFIQPHEGDVTQGDYSSIEARVAPWLVGEEKTLNLFRKNKPIYAVMASRIFGIPVKDIEDITLPEDERVKDSEKRFVGKQAVLGCSYNMGRPKFRGTCESFNYTPSEEMVEAYKPRHREFVEKCYRQVEYAITRRYAKKGKDLPKSYNRDKIMQMTITQMKWGGAELGEDGLTPDTIFGELNERQWIHFTYDDLADRAVTTWREENSIVVRSWRELDNAAKEAIKNPWIEDGGEIIRVGKLQLACLGTKFTGLPGNTLCIKLPSGHYLQYPKARVVKNKTRGWGTVIEFWGVIPNSGGKWGWCSTYGGKLLENCTQATAGDIMRHGMLQAEKKGYLPFMLVHDEMLAIQKKGQTHEEMCRLLCFEADWMKGLPLAAEGSTIPFYKK